MRFKSDIEITHIAISSVHHSAHMLAFISYSGRPISVTAASISMCDTPLKRVLHNKPQESESHCDSYASC